LLWEIVYNNFDGVNGYYTNDGSIYYPVVAPVAAN